MSRLDVRPMDSLRHNGLAIMALASALYSGSAALVKLAAAELPSSEVVFFRSGIMVLLLLTLSARRGDLSVQALLGQNRPLLFLRGMLGSVALLLFFFALSRMSVGDTLLIFQTTPVFVALVAWLTLRERQPWSFWLIAAVALGGVALIIRPSGDFGDLGALAILGAAMISGGAYTAVRKLRSERRDVVVFYFAGLSTLMAIPVMLWAGFAWPSPLTWLALGGIGVLSVVAQLLMTEAYALDKAGRVALANYTGPVVAILLDLVVWGVAPPWTTAAGGVLVIGALVTLHRTRSTASSGT